MNVKVQWSGYTILCKKEENFQEEKNVFQRMCLQKSIIVLKPGGLCPLRVHMWSSNPKHDDIRKWDFGEVITS